jgi:hypothetical protein
MTDAAFAPREIARIVQAWLDHQDAERKREGLPTDDDTHLMTPPVWPNRGALKNWVTGLNGAAAEIERLRAALEEVLKMSADVPSEDGGELLEALCKRALGNEQEADEQ